VHIHTGPLEQTQGRKMRAHEGDKLPFVLLDLSQSFVVSNGFCAPNIFQVVTWVLL